jgi:hypothetical protein
MHAYIIDGGTVESRAAFIADKTTGQTELIHVVTEKSSITIKQIQDLSEPLSIKARLPRIVWIEEANLITTPAQNALLKMLEEPPYNTTFYLTCQSSTALLPTIRSRAKTESLSQDAISIDPTILTGLKRIMGLSAGDRLTEIKKMDRAEATLYLTQIEHALRDKLHARNLTRENQLMLGKIAKLAGNAHLQLAANCSVGLTLQCFYLALPKVKL